MLFKKASAIRKRESVHETEWQNSSDVAEKKLFSTSQWKQRMVVDWHVMNTNKHIHGIDTV